MSLSNEEIGAKLSAVAASMRGNNFTEALKGLEELLTQADSNPNINKFLSSMNGMLSECLFAMSKPEEAIVPAEKSIKFSEEQGDIEGVADGYFSLYEIYRYVGNTEKAAECLAKTIPLLKSVKQDKRAKNYENQLAIVRKGEPLSRIVVNIDGQIFELDQLETQLPDIRSTRISFNFQRNRITNPRARFVFEKGRAAGAEGKHAEAREMFLEARKIDPHDPYFPYEQGLAEMYLKNYSGALKCFQETQKLAPGWFHVVANIKLAELMVSGAVDHDTFQILHVVEDGNLAPPQKVVVCQKIIELAKLPIAYLHLGQALQQLRRLEEAKRALEAGLELKDNLDDDVKTRLLFQLATACPDLAEKTRLLNESISCGGNLTCKAMAMVTKIIDARKENEKK